MKNSFYQFLYGKGYLSRKMNQLDICNNYKEPSLLVKFEQNNGNH